MLRASPRCWIFVCGNTPTTRQAQKLCATLEALSRASVVTRQLVQCLPGHGVPTGLVGAMSHDRLENENFALFGALDSAFLVESGVFIWQPSSFSAIGSAWHTIGAVPAPSVRPSCFAPGLRFKPFSHVTHAPGSHTLREFYGLWKIPSLALAPKSVSVWPWHLDAGRSL